MTKFEANPPESRTFARQGELPKLPIPSLEETCARYLRALEGLQDQREHAETKRAVEEFLHHDGPRIQEKLKEYARNKARCASSLDPPSALLPLTRVCVGNKLHRGILVRPLAPCARVGGVILSVSIDASYPFYLRDLGTSRTSRIRTR